MNPEQVKEIARGVVNEFADRLWTQADVEKGSAVHWWNLKMAKFPDPPKKEPECICGTMIETKNPSDSPPKCPVHGNPKTRDPETVKQWFGGNSIGSKASFDNEPEGVGKEIKGLNEEIHNIMLKTQALFYKHAAHPLPDLLTLIKCTSLLTERIESDAHKIRHLEKYERENKYLFDNMEVLKKENSEFQAVKNEGSLEMVTLRAENSELRREVRELKDENGRIAEGGIYSNHKLEKENFELRAKLKEQVDK